MKKEKKKIFIGEEFTENKGGEKVRTICENDNIGCYINELMFGGYKYIVKAQDKFMKKHIQLIACKTPQERETILQDLRNDKTFNYVNWYSIQDRKSIYNTIRNKTYTIRNDWTRCF